MSANDERLKLMIEESMRIIGENIRKYRLKRGLTQEDLSEAAGIHYTFVGHIERGNKSPSLETLVRLAKSLGVPAAALVEGIQ